MNNDQNQRAGQQEPPKQTTSNTGNQQTGNDQNDPANRLQDGTNDFQNGDQEPSSERSSKQE